MLASQPSGASHERIGRYEVLRKIATGGMAELFLAKQVGMEGFERVVALKRILAHLAYDEEFINMFRDEARIVAKLSHPNIVQIFDLGKSEDTYFIAMEYIPGRNLSSVAKKAAARGEKLPPQNIARCVAQACEGLHYAHTRSDLNGKPLRIVHRDVSPQNIIVAFSGTVKLVDFGIAKAATKIAHTRAGVLKGKYAYMSPEQIRGEEVDARSDLFAVGIVLYELLCGRRPFEKENSIQTLKAIVQEAHRDCRTLNPDIPDGLAEIIDRALSKDRNVRFQDAQELQLALEDFVSASGQRVNNLTIEKWITGLFEEELSRELGGTVVFQGIGEVILPDVEPGDTAAPPAQVEGTTEPPPPPAPSSSSEARPEPLALNRGRGGGSIGHRPPIPAPSNALVDDEAPRGSLIEEGVIDRPIEPREGYDDDATVLGTGASSVPDKPSYTDDKTEFAGSSSALPKAAPVPDVTLRGGVSEVHTVVPERESASRPEALARDVSSADLLKPLSQVSEGDFEEPDDPWDEATVGLPEGMLPDDFEDDDEDDDADLSEQDWGELSDGEFEQDATLAGLPEAWDDPTSAGIAESSARPAPVVRDPVAFDDAEPLDIDLDDSDADAGDDAFLPDPTIAQDALPEEFGIDATIAAPSISDEIIERHASQYAGFGDEATEGATQALEEYGDADVEPLDFADVSFDEVAAAESEWGNDATVAGGPGLPLPGVAGLDPDEDFDLEVSGADFDDMPPGLEVEIDHTVRAMDEEPALPVPKTDRDVDLDARTVAGVTSDYLLAGVRPEEGGTYDADEPTRAPETPSYEVPASAPGRRGQEQLGAIKLNQVAVPRGMGSEERTEGEAPAYMPESPDDIPGVQEHFELDIGIDEDAPPVQPTDLEAPSHSEPELPAALPGPTAAQARDEYSALLAPKLPAPTISNQGDVPVPKIGSTNVPPANLSLSQVLEHPAHVSKSKLMPNPRGVSTAGRSASIVGRQIRERAKGPSEPPPIAFGAAEAQPVESGVMPPPMMFQTPDPMAPGPEFMDVPAVGAPPRTRRNVLVLALVAALVVVLGGLGYLAYPLLVGPGGLLEDVGGMFGPTEPRLTIKTTPPGAKVYVDNALQRGTTPLTISGLSTGVTYTVRLEREGFQPVSQPVRLPKDRSLTWRIPLKTAAPGATPPPAAP